MAKKEEHKKKYSIFMSILKILWFILKIPYYIIIGIYKIVDYLRDKNIENKVFIEKSKLPIYDDFKLLETVKGDYEKFIKKVYTTDNKIGVIIGARGTGKTAFGIKFLENMHSRYKKKCYAIGFNKNEMPDWINVVTSPEEIGNDSIVLIDEGGILFSSRKSMSTANKLLSELILVSRHKNMSILFISQNSSNLDINILRQADFLIFKKSSLLQKEFERKIIQKIYNEIEDKFDKLENIPGILYVYSDEFCGFITNTLPSFWGNKISKSFR